MKKQLVASFLLALCLNTHAQTKYEQQITTLREEKAAELAKEQYGPLKSDQVAFLDYFPVDASYKVKSKKLKFCLMNPCSVCRPTTAQAMNTKDTES